MNLAIFVWIYIIQKLCIRDVARSQSPHSQTSTGAPYMAYKSALPDAVWEGTVGDALSYQVRVYFVISSTKFCVSSITPLTKCRHTDSMGCLPKVCASNTNRDMKKPWHIYEAAFTTSIVWRKWLAKLHRKCRLLCHRILLRMSSAFAFSWTSPPSHSSPMVVLHLVWKSNEGFM
jgi:hypothetical protein